MRGRAGRARAAMSHPRVPAAQRTGQPARHRADADLRPDRKTLAPARGGQGRDGQGPISAGRWGSAIAALGKGTAEAPKATGAALPRAGPIPVRGGFAASDPRAPRPNPITGPCTARVGQTTTTSSVSIRYRPFRARYSLSLGCRAHGEQGIPTFARALPGASALLESSPDGEMQ